MRPRSRTAAAAPAAAAPRNRLRNTLVVVEVALSLMLLVGASLFVRSFLNIQNADAGLDTAPLMTMRMLHAEASGIRRPRR